MNHKLVHRSTRRELAIRRHGRQNRGLGGVLAAPGAIAANQRWSLDFVEDCLADGRRFRTANLKDDCTRECPAIASTSRCPASGWSPCSRTSPANAATPTCWSWIMAPSCAVVISTAGPMRRRAAVLHRSRQADAERLDRELQRPLREECLDQLVQQPAEARRVIEAGGSCTVHTF
jgi:putative transposase